MKMLLAAAATLLLPVWLGAQVPPQATTGKRSTARAETVSRHETRHLEVRTFLSDDTVAPGDRFSIVLEITPKPGMHVYAPGEHDYRVITLNLEEDAGLRTYPMAYPESTEHVFEPLDERVQVYEEPFRLTQELEVEPDPAAESPQADVTLTGVLDYQACTDAICYAPEKLPLSWVVKVEGRR